MFGDRAHSHRCTPARHGQRSSLRAPRGGLATAVGRRSLCSLRRLRCRCGACRYNVDLMPGCSHNGHKLCSPAPRDGPIGCEVDALFFLNERVGTNHVGGFRGASFKGRCEVFTFSAFVAVARAGSIVLQSTMAVASNRNTSSRSNTLRPRVALFDLLNVSVRDDRHILQRVFRWFGLSRYEVALHTVLL